MLLIVFFVRWQKELRLIPGPGGLSLPLPFFLRWVEIIPNFFFSFLLLDLPILAERIGPKVDEDFIELPLLIVDFALYFGFKLLDQD
jgi:hypothetical protein